MTSCPSFSSRFIPARVRLTQVSALRERRRRFLFPGIERDVCVWIERGISGLAAGKRLETQLATGSRPILPAACVVEAKSPRKMSLHRSEKYIAAINFETRNARAKRT